MAYDNDDILQISGIQHFIFCRRQWALAYLEDSWVENYLTLIGDELHKKVDNPFIKESRNAKFIERAMRINSRRLGLSGICDVVEFIENPDGVRIFGKSGEYLPIPVEYKRGKQKSDHSDELQLLAEAVCLEEMLYCHLDYGYLYYGQTKHRERVEFSKELRDELNKAVAEMHRYWEKKYTPRVKPSKKCRSCSLKDICLPELLKTEKVSDYIKRRLEG
ncbi:CRISPR-associated protein Cas4 [Limosilactobacillus fermentum]|uniref:CRISPR-associated protein Cas4 n=1 Tax=Limosilactobacillus fermentum TaxID=1613 RepID=UPI0010761DCD|nr:CRISPR-associated protein Cas4 [Limosilactobacillus fermentum]TFZ15012.1 CRISPR-associated protein Cas4 [Limosilactobacillus fermentum]